MKKPTLTVGIPAYNEAGNIAQLLQSIIAQRKTSYRLESIIVVASGCTDATANIVEAFQKKFGFITLINESKRLGKAEALNRIYKYNQSDYLFTIDADIVLKGAESLNSLVTALEKDKRAVVAGARHVIVKPHTFFGNLSYVSYRSLEDAFLQINDGNNFYAMMGVALMRKSFSKSFKYPKGTISDQCYLFAKATRHDRHGFTLVREAEVYFRGVETFHDWRLLGVRSVIGDKADVSKHFGEEILQEYAMPKDLYFRSLLRWLFRSPVYTLGAILMNIYIRLFPYKKVIVKNGMWETTMSAKTAIEI